MIFLSLLAILILIIVGLFIFMISLIKELNTDLKLAIKALYEFKRKTEMTSEDTDQLLEKYTQEVQDEPSQLTISEWREAFIIVDEELLEANKENRKLRRRIDELEANQNRRDE